MKPPHNVAFLERAIRRLYATNEDAVCARVTMANVIVGQFLDGAVMRGGGSLKLRYGEATTRYTMDFDTARSVSEDCFASRYAERLARGWNGFSGRLVKMPKPHPRDVPSQYVMQPYEVKLTYLNHSWCSVDLEVAYDEVGDADTFDLVPLPPEVLNIFRSLNFPDPNPVPLMRIPHQVAQKLHGVTDSRFERAQDLIDLQLIFGHEELDFGETRLVCERLFANRHNHDWPGKLTPTPLWHEAYDAMKGGLQVSQDFDDAVSWVNNLIARIAQS